MCTKEQSGADLRLSILLCSAQAFFSCSAAQCASVLNEQPLLRNTVDCVLYLCNQCQSLPVTGRKRRKHRSLLYFLACCSDYIVFNKQKDLLAVS